METSLYRPVKRFLEARGFEVKGEVCGCDVVAVHRSGAPLVVIGELKLAFNLELVLQGVEAKGRLSGMLFELSATQNYRNPANRAVTRFFVARTPLYLPHLPLGDPILAVTSGKAATGESMRRRRFAIGALRPPA